MNHHTEASELFHTLAIPGHDMNCYAAARALWSIYQRHPAGIVNRHLSKILKALGAPIMETQYCPVFEICGEIVAGRWFSTRAAVQPRGNCMLLGHLVRKRRSADLPTWEPAPAASEEAAVAAG